MIGELLFPMACMFSLMGAASTNKIYQSTDDSGYRHQDILNEKFPYYANLAPVETAPEGEESLIDQVTENNNDVANDPILIDEGKETPNLIEGDILLSEGMKNELKEYDYASLFKRNAQRNRHYLWTNKIVPYEIDSTLTKNVAVIKQSMDDFHKSTCIKFVPRTNQKNWIKFVKKSGCWSVVGRQYFGVGYQEISLGNGCYSKKTIIHELMHAIGFWHEQSRPDRDKYVEIFWEHVQQGKESNFQRHSRKVIDNLGVNYDYNSIVHYITTAFSKNRQLTVTAVGDPHNLRKIGPGDTFSALDIVKINALYCQNNKECPSSSLGVENGGSIPDANFAASSYLDFFGFYNPHRGRLNSYSSWCPKYTTRQFIQVDLGAVKPVCTLATQGNTFYPEWVKKYKIKYSTDGKTWRSFKENGVEKVFVGNTDKSTIVNHKLPFTIKTRYIRFYPIEAHEWPCMRVGVFGGEPRASLSPWSSWAPCDRVTCQKSRQRFCTSSNRAADCPSANVHGIISEVIKCTRQECTAPIDGHWNKWSSWSSCSKTCGLGTHTRTRTCDDPAPSFGGKTCKGSNSMRKTCRDKFCGMGPDGCSFTKSLCTWSQDPFSDIPWIRHSYSTPSINTGPSRDHTAPDGSGYYIYLEASGVSAGTRAILRSNVQPGINGQRCLSFFYNMYGHHIGSLLVKLQVAATGERRLLKAALTGNKGNHWFLEKITYTSTQDYMLIFEGIRGAAYPSDMAIDDVSLLWGPCESPTPTNPHPNVTPTITVEDTCDFSAGFGTWKNAISGDQFDWTRHQKETPSPETGPSGDHTTGKGYYAYIETSAPRTIGQRARLISKSFSKDYKCLSFWYNMNGLDVWQLNVYKTTSKEILLWTEHKNSNDRWQHAIVPLGGTESFRVIIEGVRGRGYKGDIAIDDIVVARQTCTSLKPPNANPVLGTSYSFDGLQKECSWVDLPGTFYWISYRGATPTPGTGPNADHSGSGYYMCIESSSPRVKGDKARIASPYINPGQGGQCFRFWYYMYGSGIGTLTVYKETITSSSLQSLLTKTGDQGNAWKTSSFFITGGEKFRIILEGEVKSSDGDIAIDDVSFTNGSC